MQKQNRLVKYLFTNTLVLSFSKKEKSFGERMLSHSFLLTLLLSNNKNDDNDGDEDALDYYGNYLPLNAY